MNNVFSLPIEGIDYNKGLSFFEGDRESYLLVIESFVKEGKSISREMQEELEQQDFVPYIIHAHSLKNISANIGADIFSKQAKALEFAGKEGRFDYIYEHHKEVINAFDKLAEGMEKLLLAEQKEKIKVVSDKKSMLSKEELLQKLTQIYEKLMDFYREEARELLKECCACQKEDIIKQLLEIDAMIEAFQYEEPAQKTAELIKKLQKQ